MVLLLQSEHQNVSPVVQAGIRDAEKRCPGFVAKMQELRARLGTVRVGFLDFGEAFWIDLGLHTTLRRCLEALTHDDALGQATRAFFDIPDARDARGNIIVESEVPAGAAIENSAILHSTIRDPGSVIRNGVVVGAKHGRLVMPQGGASLFAAVRDLRFAGPNGIAFRSVGDSLEIAPGGRHTSLFLGENPIPIVSNESVQKYNDDEYSKPILGNSLSFEEAGELVGAFDPREVDKRWRAYWNAL